MKVTVYIYFYICSCYCSTIFIFCCIHCHRYCCIRTIHIFYVILRVNSFICFSLFTESFICRANTNIPTRFLNSCSYRVTCYISITIIFHCIGRCYWNLFVCSFTCFRIFRIDFAIFTTYTMSYFTIFISNKNIICDTTFF